MPIVARFITKAFVKSSQINLPPPLSDSDFIYGRPLREEGSQGFCDDSIWAILLMCVTIGEEGFKKCVTSFMDELNFLLLLLYR